MGALSVPRHCLAVSAVNFTEGGPLTVLQEFVDTACQVLSSDWDIVVFVHDRHLITATRPQLIEIPHSKRSWLRRLWFEWYELRNYADRIRPSLWVSLHDITPNVGRVPQVVYCHNPSPFYPLYFREALFEPILIPFRFVYQWVYRLNINKNVAVIVQQSWLRAEFSKWTNATTKVIVAHPAVSARTGETGCLKPCRGSAKFLYPALPRPFKNVELICRAVELLERDRQWQSEVVLTIDAGENRYARWLWSRYGGLKTIRFAGRQSRDQMQRRYAEADCLLFPSRRETWGLPITEAKQRGLPMFVAELPYARETVGNYDTVDFINVNDHHALAQKLLDFQDGKFEFQPSRAGLPDPPFVSDWASLIRVLTEGVK